MPRHASEKTPVVISGFLYTDDPRSTGIALDTLPWFAWLQAEETTAFYFQGAYVGFTARREVKQRGSFYWVAYRRVHGQLRKVYLGTAHQLTRLRLEQALAHLSS